MAYAIVKTMNMTKKILIGIGVALLCVVLLMAGFRTYLSWTHQYFRGTLTKQGEHAYTLHTATGPLPVHVSGRTRIRAGRHAVALVVRQGESAVVVGKVNENGLLEARFIRFVKTRYGR